MPVIGFDNWQNRPHSQHVISAIANVNAPHPQSGNRKSAINTTDNINSAVMTRVFNTFPPAPFQFIGQVSR